MVTQQSKDYADSSTVAALVRTAIARLRAWVVASWLARMSVRLSTSVAAATDTSTITTLFRILERYVRHSFLYRWLTAEPDPDVIVIDLRETYTVGPVIAALDRIQPTVERAWQSSGLDRVRAETTTAVRDAPIRMLSVVAVAAVLANTVFVVLDSSLSTQVLLARAGLLGVALAGTRIHTPWNALVQARTVQLLTAALEPPEPPGKHDRE